MFVSIDFVKDFVLIRLSDMSFNDLILFLFRNDLEILASLYTEFAFTCLYYVVFLKSLSLMYMDLISSMLSTK